jgi:hypothetical protein
MIFRQQSWISANVDNFPRFYQILPATVVYLLYLVIMVGTDQAAFPQIAIIMLAAAYGFQVRLYVHDRSASRLSVR